LLNIALISAGFALNCSTIFFNVLATFAELEGDLIRLSTRESMAIAQAKGNLRGKQPKLSDKQQKELSCMYETGQYSISYLAELLSTGHCHVIMKNR
jgi:hypothetical protein